MSPENCLMSEAREATDNHDMFRELCALYPTGCLSRHELKDLRRHLQECATCREELAQYRALDRRLMPLLAMPSDMADWQVSEAKRQLLDAADHAGPAATSGAMWRSLSTVINRSSIRIQTPAFAFAGVCVIAIAAVCGFWVERTSPIAVPPIVVRAAPSALTSEWTAELSSRDAEIKELSSQLQKRSGEVADAQAALSEATTDARQHKSMLAVAQAHESQIEAARVGLDVQLKEAQAKLATLEEQMSQSTAQHNADLVESVALKHRINEITNLLQEKDSRLQEQQTLLNSDRDIRELMGARDLFIADVFDVDRDGRTKKPFGRVFYTKNRSLIFYAFDLDKQKNLETRDVAFQAWGMSDTEKHQPLNLGILYLDNEAKRRWVLRFDNPDVLERINAVFVTVEPSGGSVKPSGRQLLFAYLEAQPNHP